MKRSTWPTWSGTPRARGRRDERDPLLHGRRERLLDEDRQAARRSPPRELRVGRGRRRRRRPRRARPRRSSPAGRRTRRRRSSRRRRRAPSATGSATATRRQPSRAARWRRWLRPIDPRPASPTRSGAAIRRPSRRPRPARPAWRPRGSRRSRPRARRRPRFGRTGIERTSSASRSVTGRSRSAAPGHVRLQVGLPVDRDRVVDEGPDAALGQALDHPLALAREPHRVLVPDVLAARGHAAGRGTRASPSREPRGVAPPLLGPLVEPGQLRQADARPRGRSA